MRITIGLPVTDFLSRSPARLKIGATTSVAILGGTFSLIGDACSPMTEINNAGNDRIFFSFATNANPPGTGGTATGCQVGQGCVASILLTPAVVAAWPPPATTAGSSVPFVITGGAGSQTGVGGTSGIVVDNVGAGLQQSNIYLRFAQTPPPESPVMGPSVSVRGKANAIGAAINKKTS